MNELSIAIKATGASVYPSGGLKERETQTIPEMEPGIELRAETTSPARNGFKRIPKVREDSIRELEQPTDEIRDECVAMARQTRDAFRDACDGGTGLDAELSFATTKRLIEDLWGYAYLRDRPFRDLLALLDAALKRVDFTTLHKTQRDVLRQAFSDLPRWLLDESTVQGHIERFAEHDIDVVGPLRSATGRKLRISIEEIIEE